MAHRKSAKRPTHAHRCLHLESFESRLALSAAEIPTTDFQFDGTILERWIDEQAKSDTIVIAPVVPRELPPEAIQNLLTIVDSRQQSGNVVVNLDRVRDWLDRRGVDFSFTMPATDGGYIDLSGPAGFGGPVKSGWYEEPGTGELFGSPGGPATPGELGSLDETMPSPSTSTPTPSEPSPHAGNSSNEALQAWSSLGRPAVIAIDGTAGNVINSGNVKYAGASEAGGWIALEPILASSEYDDIEALRLASPDANDSELGAAGLDLNRDNFNRDDALAGEWARAAVFEMIGGDPTESQPAGRAASGKHNRLKQGDPSISDSDEPSPTLGAAALPSQAVLLLSGAGWLDEMAEWVKARAGAAIDNLFGSDEGDASSNVTGWRDYAGAGALLAAIALERFSAGYREDRQVTDTARSEKLRLGRAEFTNRLSMRLNPIETR